MNTTFGVIFESSVSSVGLDNFDLLKQFFFSEEMRFFSVGILNRIKGDRDDRFG